MFFKKKLTESENSYLIKVGALLIHAAKIDENYSETEEKIIKKTLLELGGDKDNLNSLLTEARNKEEHSNQILEFTKEVKNLNKKDKVKIIESIWRIIYSNTVADIQETNLMRRRAGLLYIDSKTMGDIKERITQET